ncbi:MULTISPECIES: RecQ family ATP-dependent DNA helicase [Mammaliicoccus]|nr:MULTISPECIES: RecQ family ATP-dependent DNA helicase [Mammaliicoccus]MBO3077143.1 ATP-dependent DNA helicase RecQ [Mammaliicoccus vitulinus]PTI36464.1 recombinase RecQ [Mammaliicoccus vitulinus]PTI72578.1 recombinase RecQ [Mammaliicoccus vitulinus]QQT16277.1 ATP-dependent DNA helicase RecQ [Mammaliicoccus vitulinus]QQY18429.1 ATP-dependent DNA helicase RecQ [Mammaliicoccus vitulinus]
MLHSKLKQYFGYETFRNGQEETVQNILDGHDVLSILSTGAGKSLCYQLPAYITGGRVLIISPLISLMDDQVVQMKLNGEKNAVAIHSALSIDEKRDIFKSLSQYQFIFCSPEFIYEEHNFKHFKSIDFKYIVLDEAHCLSEWGFDFRPHYALISKVTQYFNHAQVIALTATLTDKMVEDIQEITKRTFKIHKEGLNRSNIMYHHFNFESEEEKDKFLLNEIKETGPTIIYVSSKKKCRELADIIYKEGYLTGIYHGDLDYQERTTVQTQFINNDIKIIVATSAFGMGINKQDVRTVIHYHLPTSPSKYVQEVGRAGRDGEPSQALSFFTSRDLLILNHLAHDHGIDLDMLNLYEQGYQLNEEVTTNIKFLLELYPFEQLKDKIQAEQDQKLAAFHYMKNYIQSNYCRRSYLMQYFNESVNQKDKCCDNCNNVKLLKLPNIKEVKRRISYQNRLNAIF